MHSAGQDWNPRWIEGLSSMEDCAEICESRSDCQASFWKKADGTCWIAHTQELANRPKPGYVLMLPLQQSAAGLETCRAGKKECENSKIQLEGDLKELDEKYRALFAQCSEVPCRANTLTTNPGPEDDGCVFSTEGARYKVHYKKLADPVRWTLRVASDSSFEACAKTCAANSNCAQFKWHPNYSIQCWTKSNGDRPVPSIASEWPNPLHMGFTVVILPARLWIMVAICRPFGSVRSWPSWPFQLPSLDSCHCQNEL
ncbi:hypothetical protein BDV26DRAFT_112474 [Aspergillus bertholletiae]|uniref:Apple domain-containing protein n=1 Tax=Aspergillus bertholletiae TaxID=1226010 RepID=A0A5N7ASV5_9EURO|nr:hypothetical protein BDV26DRAFT_112474 [Aspergillus bertholletiae]